MSKSALFCVTSLLVSVTSPVTCQPPDCSRSQYDECVRIADPLVKQAHLVFPDNMDDLDAVCRTWNRFVDCLKFYTDRCFTDQQRQQFNKAVENPIESVHLMCTQPAYQKEYLRYAPCLKNTITEPRHCSSHYNLLVDQVSQGEIISKSTLCCSHDRFKQCVLRETQRLCDNGVTDGPASKFSGQIIDKALSFLQDQCYNYIPNSGDCSTSTTQSERTFSDPLTISTSSSEVYPWSTVQELRPKEELPSRVTPPRQAATSTWLPSSSVTISEASPTPMLGSRTRPASYGRSNSWSNESPQNGVGSSNTVQMFPELTSTPANRADWTKQWTKSWQPQLNNAPVVGGATVGGNRRIEEGATSTTWYPAAGDQLGNEVEEPNQLGLRKNRNSAMKIMAITPSGAFISTVTLTVLSKYYYFF